MKINTKRLMEHIETLGKIGFEEESGTTRMAYSDSFYAGADYVQRLMEDAGLRVHLDAVGNLTGLMPGKVQKKIAVGSHIDTVPGGGIYDGALGVLSAIECLHTMRENGYRNNYSLEVIAFNEEEGNVIGGTFGSKCFAGVEIGEAEKSNMKRYGLTMEDVLSSRRRKEDYECYLELHIEQGSILENNSVQIGIVDGIVGITRFRVAVTGTGNHAGTTPMYLRDDALEKACRIILSLFETVREKYPTMVCTVGDFSVPRGAVNVVPGRVEFLIEMRNISVPPMLEVAGWLKDTYGPLGLEMVQYLNQRETMMDTELVELFERVCKKNSISFQHIFSGAGHDAINMSVLTPSAMLFIPSRGGISHSKLEYSSPRDISLGTKILLDTLLQLDSRGKKA